MFVRLRRVCRAVSGWWGEGWGFSSPLSVCSFPFALAALVVLLLVWGVLAFLRWARVRCVVCRFRWACWWRPRLALAVSLRRRRGCCLARCVLCVLLSPVRSLPFRLALWVARRLVRRWCRRSRRLLARGRVWLPVSGWRGRVVSFARWGAGAPFPAA